MSDEQRAHEPPEDDPGGMIYGMEERPPWSLVPVYAFQHIFTMITGSITGAVVIGNVVGLSAAQIAQLVNIINVAVGIATIVQVKWGVRYPVIQGSTSAFLPAYISIGGIAAGLYNDPLTVMQYLMGALIVGAVFEMAFGFLGGLRLIKSVLSPLLIGIVIMMVGLGLWPVLNDFIGADWHIAVGVFVMAVAASSFLGRMARTMAVFITVVVWYAVAAAGTWQGWFPQGSALHVDFASIAEAPWFQAPRPFAWGMPKFHAGFILAMLLPFVATMLEITGDFFAVAKATDTPRPSIARLGRGIGTEGAGTLVSGILGGTATSTFSQNIGLLRLSGVASRFVCVVAGGILIVLGLVGKLGALLGGIPQVILGAVYLLVFGMLIMTGLHLVMRADLKTPRNEILVGTSLLLGLALPAYMSENPLSIGGSPTLEIFVNVFLATPMMVAGVWAAVLDNVLPGTDEERGIAGWFEGGEDEAGEDGDPDGSG